MPEQPIGASPQQATELKGNSGTTSKESIKLIAADVKPTPPVVSSREAKIDEDVILSLSKAKRRQELAEEYGPEEKKDAEIPSALPQAAFYAVSVGIDCPKFQLSDKEAEVMTNSLNEIIKFLGVPLSNLIIHVCIVCSITFIKAMHCKDAITKRMNGFKGAGGKRTVGMRTAYDERTQSVRPVR